MITRRRGVAVLVVALALLWPAHRTDDAGGQEIPIPTVPPLPPEVAPLLELVAPTVWPACADAAIAVIALPVLLPALGLPVTPEILQLTAPVLVVCGSVPEPSGRRTCELDGVAGELLAMLLRTIVGTPVPLLVEPVGMAVGQVIEIEDRLPVPSAGIGATAAGVLRCGAAGAPQPAPQPAPRPVAVPPVSPPSAPSVPPAGAAPTPGPARPSVASAPAVVAPGLGASPSAAPATERVTSTITFPRFSYPVLLLLPLVLLVLGGYAARALTAPIEPVTDRPARSRGQGR